jgi:hypothetical protein
MRGSPNNFPDCANRRPRRLRKALPVLHPIGGATPFARVERHRAHVGVPSKNLAPGLGRGLFSGSSGEGVSSPRRQRIAAACLLSAIELPADASAWAIQLKQAPRVCPNITMDQVAVGSKRDGLLKARVLIDEMLNEQTD